MMVKKYNSYCINGCIFHTHNYGKGKSTQCDGVKIVAATSSFSSAKDKNPVVGDVSYYGRILEIFELNYSNQGYVVLQNMHLLALLHTNIGHTTSPKLTGICILARSWL